MFDFIDYSSFLSSKLKARQILPDGDNKLIEYDLLRHRICNKLSIKINNLAIPGQIHSNNVKFINKSGFFKNTDGLITDNEKIILSLQTADCLPIFLFDELNNIKGLIHSGWKGTRDKIVEKALNIMVQKGSSLSNIMIVIGASIHKCCYEIKDDLTPFFDKSCIYTIGNQKYLSLQEQILIDLSKLNIQIENVYIDEKCTFDDTRLSSYRREKANAGRMFSLLGNFIITSSGVVPPSLSSINFMPL